MQAESVWFRTPIYILNFNQVSHLRKLLAWLLRAGYSDITVLDNHSTYPPLLAFYDEVTARPEISVIRRARNDPKDVVWNEHLRHRRGPFVLTSSDVVPDACCPDDVVLHLASHLRENPQLYKAGLGLRIDNLPERYGHRAQVRLKQSEYWRAPAVRGGFLAPIDFTFALYRSGGDFSFGPAVRTSWPYLARHEPWYSDSGNRTEEERFYADTLAPGRGSWGREELPKWILDTCAQIAADPFPRLVHLGCGQDRFPGWINVDADPSCKPDVVLHPESGGPYRWELPLASDSVDGFFGARIFERVAFSLALLAELHRVARPSARLVLRFNRPDAAHLEGLSPAPEAMDLYLKLENRETPVNSVGHWRVERIRHIVNRFAQSDAGTPASSSFGDSDVGKTCELVVHLRAMKPVDPFHEAGGHTPIVEISHSPLDIASSF